MNYAERLKLISQNLRNSKKVNTYDSKERESDTLAHCLLDLEESFNVIVNDLLPKLESSDISEEQVNNVLLDIGEELRHVLYHVNDTKFYKYLLEDMDK